MIVKENSAEKVNSARDVAKVLSSILEMESKVDRDKEHFWIIGLNAMNVIKFIDLVSLGTLTSSLVHPREVFRVAVSRGGIAGIIAVHNHPSGDPAPSREDIGVTERLKKAGDILGVQVLDHVVIGDGETFVSFQEQGIFSNPK